MTDTQPDPDPDPERDEDEETDGEDEDEEREETQVTRLLSGMKEVVFEQIDCTRDLGAKADRVSRLARRPQSVQSLSSASVVPPDPFAE